MDGQILYGILGLMLLFAPGLIAQSRKHHNQNAIFLVSMIGAATALAVPIAGGAIWVASLVWASTNPPPSKP